MEKIGGNDNQEEILKQREAHQKDAEKRANAVISLKDRFLEMVGKKTNLTAADVLYLDALAENEERNRAEKDKRPILGVSPISLELGNELSESLFQKKRDKYENKLKKRAKKAGVNPEDLMYADALDEEEARKLVEEEYQNEVDKIEKKASPLPIKVERAVTLKEDGPAYQGTIKGDTPKGKVSIKYLFIPRVILKGVHAVTVGYFDEILKMEGTIDGKPLSDEEIEQYIEEAKWDKNRLKIEQESEK